MNDALPSTAIPPSFPRATRSNILGAGAFGIAVSSAGVTAAAIHMLREHARYVEGFAPGMISGGTAFSLNFYPFAVTIFAFAFGAFSLLLLVTSCWLARLNRHRIFSVVHIGAGVLLLPFVYLSFVFIRGFFR